MTGEDEAPPGTAGTTFSSRRPKWINLTTGKEFSRILYPNPVCFMSTLDNETGHRQNCDFDSSINPRGRGGDDNYYTAAQPSPSVKGDDSSKESSSIIQELSIDAKSSNDDRSISPDSRKSSRTKFNVMVLSWLTPTNNHGRFMFSIRKSRYSASLLAPSKILCDGVQDSESFADATKIPSVELSNERRKRKTVCQSQSNNQRRKIDGENEILSAKGFHTGIEFALSVPVEGMEQLVLDVGSISGKFGSKFPHAPTSNTHTHCNQSTKSEESKQMSNRQKKKLKKQQLSLGGVPGLIPVPLGETMPCSEKDLEASNSLFAIHGTVAHLRCRTYSVIGTSLQSRMEKSDCGDDGNEDDPAGIIDDDHLLVMAEVIDAFVHPSYWNSEKLLFQPRGDLSDGEFLDAPDDTGKTANKRDESYTRMQRCVPPYLTFYGSQEFGYVVTKT